MIAFGGAAPLHAGHLCDKLGIRELLVPTGAGVGSAIGFLRTPFAHEAGRSLFLPLEDFDPTVIDGMLGELRAEAEAFVRQLSPIRPTIERSAFMRDAGQWGEIPPRCPMARSTRRRSRSSCCDSRSPTRSSSVGRSVVWRWKR